MKTSLKQMQTLRAEIMTSAAQLGPKMHDFFVMALYHAAPTAAGGNGHGDVTVLDNLFTDLHKSQRTDSIRQWFSTNSPIRWDKETGKAKIAADGMKKPETWNLKNAEEFPFFHKEEKVPQFRLHDIEQTLKNEAKRLIESAEAFAAGQTDIWDKAIEKDASFKPARRMAEIARMQAALGYTVTAKPEILEVAPATEAETLKGEAA